LRARHASEACTLHFVDAVLALIARLAFLFAEI
jgi:hypothetical protein